jgi:putative transposase
VIEEHFADLEAVTSTSMACELLGASRATRYRRRRSPVLGPPPPRPSPPNALSRAEREHVLSVLRSQDYCDLAPAQIWARLLDDATYLCSISTMYRILASVGENRERRRQRTHPAKKKPELIARKPLQVWTWDITKLRGPERGIYYQLYVIIDIFSRYVVGWMVAAAETGELAEAFIAEILAQHKVDRDQLTLHADRGTSMTSKPVVQLLIDLGVDRSHSRPHVSNDNPYSEANFKTLKYCPAFPSRFGSIEDARASVLRSSSTTTTCTAIPGSVCIPRRQSTTARPRRSAPSVPSPSRPLTPPTQPGSATDGRDRRSCRRLLGSTSRARRHSSDPLEKVSQRA